MHVSCLPWHGGIAWLAGERRSESEGEGEKSRPLKKGIMQFAAVGQWGY